MCSAAKNIANRFINRDALLNVQLRGTVTVIADRATEYDVTTLFK